MIELKWATVICSTMALLVYQMVYQIVFRHLPLCPIISHYIPFYAIISHFMPFYPIMSHYIPFYAILSHFMPLYPILCHSIPFYAILSQCPIISHFMPFYPTISQNLCHSLLLYLTSFYGENIWQKSPERRWQLLVGNFGDGLGLLISVAIAYLIGAHR